jgi:hypothetical protein
MTVIRSRPPVLDYKAPSSTRAVAALEEGDTRARLLKFGTWFAGSDAGGEDLLADALMCVCDPEEGRPWDPSVGTFGTHMRMVMTDLARRERRSSRARHEILSPKKVKRARSLAPIADQALDDARRLDRMRRSGEVLRERLATRPRALQVLDARMEGTERADELAQLLGCQVEEVYEANRQIAYHAAKVLAEEQAAEDARMKELRDRAKKDEPS